MARKAGVTAEETKAQLLDAAAHVFSERGYEGARVEEIARRAGLSTGAIYAHYANKSDLLLETIRSHSDGAVHGTVAGETAASLFDGLTRSAVSLGRSGTRDGLLLLEAIVAGRRDAELGSVLRETVTRRESKLADMVRAERDQGGLSPTVRPDAAARLCMLLGLGAVVARALELDPPDEDDWNAVVRGLLAPLAPSHHESPQPVSP